MSSSDAELFLSEVADAKPLRDRDRIPAPRPEPAIGRAKAAKAVSAPRPVLVVEREGEAAWARGPGVSRAQLAELRAGRVEPEAEIDLHGRRAADAADTAEAFVEASIASGRRCVLVISGRGRRTGNVSVVKEEVLDRLATGRAARQIRALCTAHPRHGGAGAIYVALKKS